MASSNPLTSTELQQLIQAGLSTPPPVESSSIPSPTDPQKLTPSQQLYAQTIMKLTQYPEINSTIASYDPLYLPSMIQLFNGSHKIISQIHDPENIIPVYDHPNFVSPELIQLTGHSITSVPDHHDLILQILDHHLYKDKLSCLYPDRKYKFVVVQLSISNDETLKDTPNIARHLLKVTPGAPLPLIPFTQYAPVANGVFYRYHAYHEDFPTLRSWNVTFVKQTNQDVQLSKAVMIGQQEITHDR